MNVKSLKRDDGRPFGFWVDGASFACLCRSISQFPGVVFTRKRRFFWWYSDIRAEFTFKGNAFEIETDPLDNGFWIAPKDKEATHPEIQEIQSYVEKYGVSSFGLMGNPA